MHYIINNSIICDVTKEEGLVIAVAGSEMFSIVENYDEVLEMLLIYSEPHTYEEGLTLINSIYYLSEEDYRSIFETMRIYNLLKESSDKKDNEGLSEYHLEKYKRQISSLNLFKGIEYQDAIHMQKSICKSKVCIIGVGGTGSHLALALASIGVEELILVDFDHIELSNTSRQVLYDETDIGKEKLIVAQEKLKKYNSRVNITTYQVHINRKDDLSFLEEHRYLDIIVLCADTPRGQIQYIVDEAAQFYKIPWFYYGPYHHSQIVVGPYIVPEKTKKYSELFPKDILVENVKTEKINSNFVASICDPYNGFASQFAAIEVFKILSKYRETALLNCRYYINTDTWEMEKIEYDTDR